MSKHTKSQGLSWHRPCAYESVAGPGCQTCCTDSDTYLPSCVHKLKMILLSIYCDQFCESIFYGWIVGVNKLAFNILNRQRGFPHRPVAQDRDLPGLGLRHLSGLLSPGSTTSTASAAAPALRSAAAAPGHSGIQGRGFF